MVQPSISQYSSYILQSITQLRNNKYLSQTSSDLLAFQLISICPFLSLFVNYLSPADSLSLLCICICLSDCQFVYLTVSLLGYCSAPWTVCPCCLTFCPSRRVCGQHHSCRLLVDGQHIFPLAIADFCANTQIVLKKVEIEMKVENEDSNNNAENWARIIQIIVYTMCPRSIYLIFIVSYYIKWVTTSWTQQISDIYILNSFKKVILMINDNLQFLQ